MKVKCTYSRKAWLTHDKEYYIENHTMRDDKNTVIYFDSDLSDADIIKDLNSDRFNGSRFIKVVENIEDYTKPPLGLPPKIIHDKLRCQDICDAIERYCKAKKKVPIEWLKEYNELVEIIESEAE